MHAINPTSLGAPRGYSHGVLAPAGGRLLFVAGQIAWDKEEQIVCLDFPGQLAQALKNVMAVVEAARGGPHHVTQLTLFVTDKGAYLSQLKAVGEAYRSVMGRHFPAMALIEVKGLLDPAALIEIQGMAVIPTPTSGL